MKRSMIGTTIAVCGIAASSTLAQTVTNPGFNDATGWTIANDAELGFAGGAAGWTWNTPVVPDIEVTATEDVFPTEGSGFMITYAGFDSATQTVNIPSAGEYTISVDYQGVAGRIDGPGIAGPLSAGTFTLIAGGMRPGGINAPVAGGWQTFEWTVNLPAGDITVGLENTAFASYVIAFDNFRIVPAPGAGVMMLAAGGLIARRRRG